MKAAELFVKCLENEEVEYIFGVPGEENADVMISLLDSKVTKSVLEKLVGMQAKPGDDENLTAREREVLVLIADGATNKEIAAKLVVSENTARNHVSHILSKLGFSRRSEAAAYAVRKGLTKDN